ncbi:DUF4142 domain-containing protein [Fibrella arboris]|uniref:DUF4142 domain-containing protein n=1 Tax=Fibrella arboris TaxID=3242486 RepID=UPI0035226B5B
MKKRTLVYLLAMSCLTFQACNSEKKATSDSVENAENANETKEEQGAGAEEDDSEFAVKAASGGLLEVELGKLAQEKGQDAEVKQFGAKMVEDHTKANDELKALATLKNITIPSTPGEDKQKDIDDMRKLSGAEFDKKYISYMKDDHEEDVKEFKKAAQDAKDQSIKEFAAKTLPTLQMHLDMVTAIDKKLN